MKQLFIVLVLITFNETFGHKCYSCNEKFDDQSCKDPRVHTCPLDFNQSYCATILFKRRPNEPQRIAKSCLPNGHDFYCNSDSAKDWMVCCEGELCNNTNKLSSKTIVIILSFVFVFLTVQ